jgi:hypothetical protein
LFLELSSSKEGLEADPVTQTGKEKLLFASLDYYCCLLPSIWNVFIEKESPLHVQSPALQVNYYGILVAFHYLELLLKLALLVLLEGPHLHF